MTRFLRSLFPFARPSLPFRLNGRLVERDLDNPARIRLARFQYDLDPRIPLVVERTAQETEQVLTALEKRQMEEELEYMRRRRPCPIHTSSSRSWMK